MFWHIFSNRLKCIIRDKQLVFWTLVFPLILATLFSMTLINISKQEAFKSIDIAVVNNEAYQKDVGFKNFLTEASQGDNKLFNINLTTKEEAEKLLDNGKVEGYITVETQINLVVKNSGLNQTIIKSVLDEYNQTVSAVNSIVTDNPTALQNGLLEDVGKRIEFTKNIQAGTKEKPDSAVNYFYTLIAMACLYGSFFGLKEITDIQADLSKRAARLNVAPVHKLKVLVSGLCAGFAVLLLEISILLSYLVFAMKVDFGDQIGYILLTCFVGCATGISFGAIVSAIIKKREGVKTAILIGATMTACFLSGMMYGNMKYIVEKNVPILAYINPAALITDAFYALYYYDTPTRFFTNIGLLSGLTVIFCLVTYLIIRRQKYASI
ncbi:MAG TPA: ABC transporter permease [Ruminiclostridium sp.]